MDQPGIESSQWSIARLCSRLSMEVGMIPHGVGQATGRVNQLQFLHSTFKCSEQENLHFRSVQDVKHQ